MSLRGMEASVIKRIPVMLDQKREFCLFSLLLLVWLFSYMTGTMWYHFIFMVTILYEILLIATISGFQSPAQLAGTLEFHCTIYGCILGTLGICLIKLDGLWLICFCNSLRNAAIWNDQGEWRLSECSTTQFSGCLAFDHDPFLNMGWAITKKSPWSRLFLHDEFATIDPGFIPLVSTSHWKPLKPIDPGFNLVHQPGLFFINQRFHRSFDHLDHLHGFWLGWASRYPLCYPGYQGVAVRRLVAWWTWSWMTNYHNGWWTCLLKWMTNNYFHSTDLCSSIG